MRRAKFALILAFVLIPLFASTLSTHAAPPTATPQASGTARASGSAGRPSVATPTSTRTASPKPSAATASPTRPGNAPLAGGSASATPPPPPGPLTFPVPPKRNAGSKSPGQIIQSSGVTRPPNPPAPAHTFIPLPSARSSASETNSGASVAPDYGCTGPDCYAWDYQATGNTEEGTSYAASAVQVQLALHPTPANDEVDCNGEMYDYLGANLSPHYGGNFVQLGYVYGSGAAGCPSTQPVVFAATFSLGVTPQCPYSPFYQTTSFGNGAIGCIVPAALS